MKEYPYVQGKTAISNFVCEICNLEKEKGYSVEWRVDIFQGNCEFVKTCENCLSKQLSELKAENTKRQAEWNRQEQIHNANLERLEKTLADNGVTVKKYPSTGQWVLNNIIDWWTTTGTAIHRKTRKRYTFRVKKPQEIINALKPSENL